MRPLGRITAHLLPLALLVVAASARAADVIEYYDTDAVGNVRLVTDAAGNVVERHDYLPFGEEWCGTTVCGANRAPGEPLRFTGKERDAETGLDYFGARYYRANAGRFTTVDPAYTIQANLVDPQRWNAYAYGRNNPLRYIDPDGKDAKEATKGAAWGFAYGGRDIGMGLLGLISGFPDSIIAGPVEALITAGEAYGTSKGRAELKGQIFSLDDEGIGSLVTESLTLGGVAALLGGPRAGSATEAEVVHFTGAAGRAGIEASGEIRAGSFVTKPGEVKGLTASEIEGRLEIQPGRGAYSFAARVPNKNLVTPGNGPTTSGGAWQGRLKESVKISGSGSPTE